MVADRAVVVGIDRQKGNVVCQIDGRQTNVSAMYLPGEPPAPRTRVVVDQYAPGQWYVLGSEGTVRALWKEDFTTSLYLPIGPVPTVFCDGVWFERTTGGSLIQTNGSTGGGFDQRQGQIALTCAAAAFAYSSITKQSGNEPYCPKAGAIWSHIVGAAFEVTGNIIAFGWGDLTMQQFAAPAAASRQVCVVFEAAVSPNWRFYTTVGVSRTVVDTGIPAVANEFVDFDIVIAPGVWAGLWINGAYAASSITNIPTFGALMGPFFGVLTGALARSVICDLFDAWHVRGAVQP